jgi:hypothetical protein
MPNSLAGQGFIRDFLGLVRKYNTAAGLPADYGMRAARVAATAAVVLAQIRASRRARAPAAARRSFGSARPFARRRLPGRSVFLRPEVLQSLMHQRELLQIRQ